MKIFKKTLSLLLVLSLVISLFSSLNFGANAETTVTSGTAEDELFLSYPSASKFDSLWVGDTVVFDKHCTQEEGGNLLSGNSLTVLDGNGAVITDILAGAGEFYKGIKFTKSGNFTVRVAVSDQKTGNSAEKPFTFTVRERPSEKSVKVRHNFPSVINMKVGDLAVGYSNDAKLKGYQVYADNLSYGVVPCAEDVTPGGLEISGDAEFIATGGRGGFSFGFVDDSRTSVLGSLDREVFYESFAGNPGTITLQPIYNGEKIGDIITKIVVEKPIIEDNAPATVNVGDSISFKTNLSNTSLKNVKVSEYAKQDWYSSNTIPIAYAPKVEVISGKDCVVQKNGDYSNTLSTLETLTFKKAGTVKLKVIYKQLELSYVECKYYNPEKTITIKVSSDVHSGHKTETTVTKATQKANGKLVTTCKTCKKNIKTVTVNKIASVKLSTAKYTYNGVAKTPSVIVKDSKGKTLKKGTDYTVNYANGRKSVGKYTVKVTFKGNYSGSKTLTFKINPKSTSLKSVAGGKKQITAKWNKQATQTTGYQVQYSTSANFKNAKIVTVASNKTTSKTIKNLSGGKKYYVRVRTYKTVKNTKYYSAWSAKKSATAKK